MHAMKCRKKLVAFDDKNWAKITTVTVRRQHNRTIGKLSVWNNRPERLSSDSPTISRYIVRWDYRPNPSYKTSLLHIQRRRCWWEPVTPVNRCIPSAARVSTNASQTQTLAISAPADDVCQSERPDTVELLANHSPNDLCTHEFCHAAPI